MSSPTTFPAETIGKRRHLPSWLFVAIVLVIAAMVGFACGEEPPTQTPVPPTPTATPTATPVPPTPTLPPDQMRGKEVKDAALNYLETVLFFQSAFEALVFEISATAETGFSVTFEDELIDVLYDVETAVENTPYSQVSSAYWSSQFEQVIVNGQSLIAVGMEDVHYILDEISLRTDEAEVLMADVLWAADESEVAAADFRSIANR